jgi:acetolactate synthase-1/2/3 large subunit
VLGTFRAYDGIDHDSPNFLGILGYGAAPVAKRVLAEADLHIFLGCVRTDVATDGFSNGVDQRTVVIGPDADAHGHFGRLDQHIVTSVSRFAQSLFTEEGTRTYSVSSDGSIDEPPLGDALSEAAGEAVPLPTWVAEARAELEAWRKPQVASASGSAASAGFVDMDEAFVHVQDLLPDDAIITYGAGNFSGWATRFLPTHGFPSALGPRNGSMGFGLPAAVAAGLVHPERSVFCIAGDGDFLMNGQEMATAVQYGSTSPSCSTTTRSTARSAAIRTANTRAGPPPRRCRTRTSLRWPRPSAGSASASRATEDFRDAFERALAHKGLSLVHCITDPAVRGARLP